MRTFNFREKFVCAFKIYGISINQSINILMSLTTSLNGLMRQVYMVYTKGIKLEILEL